MEQKGLMTTILANLLSPHTCQHWVLLNIVLTNLKWELRIIVSNCVTSVMRESRHLFQINIITGYLFLFVNYSAFWTGFSFILEYYFRVHFSVKFNTLYQSVSLLSL